MLRECPNKNPLSMIAWIHISIYCGQEGYTVSTLVVSIYPSVLIVLSYIAPYLMGGPSF